MKIEQEQEEEIIQPQPNTLEIENGEKLIKKRKPRSKKEKVNKKNSVNIPGATLDISI